MDRNAWLTLVIHAHRMTHVLKDLNIYCFCIPIDFFCKAVCGDAERMTSSTVLVKKLGRTEPDTFGATVRCRLTDMSDMLTDHGHVEPPWASCGASRFQWISCEKLPGHIVYSVYSDIFVCTGSQYKRWSWNNFLWRVAILKTFPRPQT